MKKWTAWKGTSSMLPCSVRIFRIADLKYRSAEREFLGVSFASGGAANGVGKRADLVDCCWVEIGLERFRKWPIGDSKRLVGRRAHWSAVTLFATTRGLGFIVAAPCAVSCISRRFFFFRTLPLFTKWECSRTCYWILHASLLKNAGNTPC